MVPRWAAAISLLLTRPSANPSANPTTYSQPTVNSRKTSRQQPQENSRRLRSEKRFATNRSSAALSVAASHSDSVIYRPPNEQALGRDRTSTIPAKGRASIAASSYCLYSVKSFTTSSSPADETNADSVSAPLPDLATIFRAVSPS